MPRKDLASRAEYSKQYAERNAEKLRAYRAAYRERNREKIRQAKKDAWYAHSEENKAALRARYAADPEKYRAIGRRTYEKNPDKARAYSAEYRRVNKKAVVAGKKRYAVANKGVVNAAVARRKAAKLQRTPTWADTAKIRAYYEVCAFFNEVNGYVKYHVDHVIPLQGSAVSGLHVHTNLQILLASDNVRKYNCFEVR